MYTLYNPDSQQTVESLDNAPVVTTLKDNNTLQMRGNQDGIESLFNIISHFCETNYMLLVESSQREVPSNLLVTRISPHEMKVEGNVELLDVMLAGLGVIIIKPNKKQKLGGGTD